MRLVSTSYVHPLWWWIRVRGYGLFVRPSKGYVPVFSERYGYKRAYYLLGLRIEVLRP